MKKEIKIEIAVFGMGCFWQPDYLFSRLPGVLKVEVGYMGGDETQDNLTYEEVCSDTTGHAEVVRIEYNPRRISYSELLEIFWKNHDSTQLNQQGPDVGSQYRSAIFYFTQEQKNIAAKSKQIVQKLLGKPVFTEIKESCKFYAAEDDHQKYLAKTGGVCHVSKLSALVNMRL